MPGRPPLQGPWPFSCGPCNFFPLDIYMACFITSSISLLTCCLFRGTFLDYLIKNHHQAPPTPCFCPFSIVLTIFNYYVLLIAYLFCLLSFPLLSCMSFSLSSKQAQWGQDILYFLPPHLFLCLVHSRCSICICRMNKMLWLELHVNGAQIKSHWIETKKCKIAVLYIVNGYSSSRIFLRNC